MLKCQPGLPVKPKNVNVRLSLRMFTNDGQGGGTKRSAFTTLQKVNKCILIGKKSHGNKMCPLS